MTYLARSDLESLLDFVGDVGELDFDEPYPLELVRRLMDVVPCDAITYQELDPRAQIFTVEIGFGADEDDDPDGYWRHGPCPTLAYRERTGDLEAVRTSDLIGRRSFVELPVFRDYFKPAGLEHVLDLGLPSARPQLRSFVLFRRLGARDFSERDRVVLEALRPHLYRLEAHAALRRRLAEALQELDNEASLDAYSVLTPRESQIAELLAEGKTNAQIAAVLWIAPSTVKKHLEHIYAKTGAVSRAAVVGRSRHS
ncbi:LuxR C-terminal-related transcriptional regulator [Intrasporangium calvum]|uniref:LuxR C-terminal-related transcriptional regulator n=1 Tax=Intrasporangium calvum TaxID=53358 RepID=A0ABT5GFS5_9MICO|nr:LuxR family transcriptional regulator [Intrasporangium calvum]MDC5696541.1 LuxR C-terminal-related transcriptional regulator [Intrasporangium calvum]